jgi:glycosyltransferase involved in cell wall biosynthesis
MRILHIIPGLTWERGGPSAVLRALVRHQAEAGHKVAVLTTNQGARHGETPVELAPQVAVERRRVVGPDRLAYTPGFRRAVRDRLKEMDLVHVHSIFTYPVHVALCEAKAAGVPVVLRPCGLLHLYSLRRGRVQKALYLARWGRLVRSACTAWHYTSEAEARASWPGDGSPQFVLPNGIEPEEYALERSQARAVVAETWPAVAMAPYVLFLGRLHPKKRLDLLLEAFLARAPEPYRLVVAGPDETGLWEPLSARLLRDPSKRRRCIRVSTVTGRAKAALLAGAALFALPSEHENFGVAALEALAAGTPALISPRVDLAAAVEAAGLGFLTTLDAAALGACLARVLADRDGLAAIGERARCRVREEYAWARIAQDLERRYEWVLEGCPDEDAKKSGIRFSVVGGKQAFEPEWES